jgi:hypothetical protein
LALVSSFSCRACFALRDKRVFNDCRDRRLHLDKTDASASFIPRLDDTLNVTHYKLQQLTKQDIYWWVDSIK